MAEKKSRTKIPQENKIRALLQKEIGSVCPFCDSEEVGHFQIHHIDEIPSNNEVENLLLLCSECHSKITKKDILQVDVWKRKIQLTTSNIKKESKKAKIIQFNAKVKTAVVGDNNTVTIKQKNEKIVNKYPEGSIGYERDKMNYISYLIGRYNEFKEYEVGKGNMRYGVFNSQLKKKYGIGPSKTIYNLADCRFEDLALHIQTRIDGTMLGKKRKKIQKNYSSFSEYLAKYVGN